MPQVLWYISPDVVETSFSHTRQILEFQQKAVRVVDVHDARVSLPRLLVRLPRFATSSLLWIRMCNATPRSVNLASSASSHDQQPYTTTPTTAPTFQHYGRTLPSQASTTDLPVTVRYFTTYRTVHVQLYAESLRYCATEDATRSRRSDRY